MPNIKLISALILNEVDTTGRVYFTRNGHCEYGILTIEQIDELDRYRAAYLLHSKLKKAAKEGWIDGAVLEKELLNDTNTLQCKPKY